MTTPRTLADIDLLLPLGRGGVAEVWLARKQGAPIGAEFVVKQLRDRVSRDQGVRAMLEREAELGRQATHPGLPRTLGHGELDGHVALALPFVFGADLTRIASRRVDGEPALDLEHALVVIRDAARALHALHTMQPPGEPAWVHRDVSPANLMVGYDGRTHVIDLGIAARAGGGTPGERTPEGKFAYMSPEQARNEALDPRSDIFSLGVVLYEFTTRHRLFRRDDPDAVLQAVRDADVPRPRAQDRKFPLDVEAIVLCALAPDPADRFADANELANALDDAVRARGASLDVPAVGRRLRRASTRDLAILEDVTKPGYRGAVHAPSRVPFPPVSSPPLSVSNEPETPTERDDGPPSGTVKADHDLGDTGARTSADELPPLREGRSIYAAVGVVMVALLAFVGYLIATQGVDTSIGDDIEPMPQRADFEPEPLPEPEPPPTRTVQAVSTPPGAAIVVNAVATRLVTPAEVELVDGRPNVVTLHRDGFQTARLLVAGNDDASIDVTLEALPEPEPEPAAQASDGTGEAAPEVPPGFGRIRVLARDVGGRPIEAEVLRNGQRVEGVTPVEIIVPANVEQHITVRRAGYRDSVTYAHAIPFRDLRSEREVDLEMTAAQEDARGATIVRTTATPQQAALAVDGEDQGRLQVLTLRSPGLYAIEVTAEDHEPLLQTVDARLGQFEFRPVLEPVRSGPARLSIEVDPEATEIYGERLREASAGARTLGTGRFDSEIEAGPWRLTFEHRSEEGRRRGRIELELEPGTHRALTLSLGPEGLVTEADETSEYEPASPQR